MSTKAAEHGLQEIHGLCKSTVPLRQKLVSLLSHNIGSVRVPEYINITQGLQSKKSTNLDFWENLGKIRKYHNPEQIQAFEMLAKIPDGFGVL